MKRKEWNEGLNNIDPELVEKYIQQKEKLSNNKKPKSIGLRIGVIAASLVIVLCAVLGTFLILNNDEFSNDPTIGDATDKIDSNDDSQIKGEYDGDFDENAGNNSNGGLLPNSPIGSEYHEPVESDKDVENDSNGIEKDTMLSTDIATDIATEEVAVVSKISGEKYSNYEFVGSMCAPEKVGEKIEDVMVTINSGYLYTSIEYLATVYKVVGVDSEFCLCVKFAAENEFFDDGYHFIRAKSFMFTSLDDMRDKLLDNEALFIQAYANYTMNHKTTEVYCKNFKFSDTVSGKLKQYFLDLDGLSKLTQDSEAFEEKHDEAAEFVTIYTTFNSSVGSVTGLMRIYDTGYLYYAPFGGQLFHIDETFAREIIDIVIKQGTPEGYVWNESEGKWEPIISNEMDPDSFRRALADNKLFGQINLLGEISYIAYINTEAYPHTLKLEDRYLSAIAEILDAGEGNAVEIENIGDIADSHMTFVHSWDGGETCEITVYDSGHIKLYGQYYFVGTQYTDKIINTVLLKSTNDFGLYWDKSEKVWKVQDENSSETSETQPASEDETETFDSNDIRICSKINLCYCGNKVNSVMIEDNVTCSKIMSFISKVGGIQGESSKGFYGVPYLLTVYFEGEEEILEFMLWSDTQYSTSEHVDGEGYPMFFADDMSELYQYLTEKYPAEFWYGEDYSS